MNLSDCAQTQYRDGQPGDSICEDAVVRHVASTCEQAINSDELRKNIDADGSWVLATSEQAVLFEDNMETSAWEWSRFLNFSPAGHQSSPDNES